MKNELHFKCPLLELAVIAAIAMGRLVYLPPKNPLNVNFYPATLLLWDLCVLYNNKHNSGSDRRQIKECILTHTSRCEFMINSK